MLPFSKSPCTACGLAEFTALPPSLSTTPLTTTTVPACLQADLSRLLLERLPEFCDAQGEEAPLPQLILGQFRWCVADCWLAGWLAAAGSSLRPHVWRCLL